MWLPGSVLWAPQLQAVVLLWPRAAGISESPAMAIHRPLWNELVISVYLQPDRCSQPQNLCCLPSFPWEWLRNKSWSGFNCWFLGCSWGQYRELEMPKIEFLFVWGAFFLKYSVSRALNGLKNEMVKCLKILFYVSKQTFILSFITLVKFNVLFILYIFILQKMF